MTTPSNTYRVDLRELRFLLWEQFRIQDTPLLGDLDRELIDLLLDNAKKFAYQELGPYYMPSDREGCTLGPDGRVSVPSAYHRAFAAFREAGWGSLAIPAAHGGMGAPYVVSQLVNEIFMGADPSFMAYSGFCAPAIFMLERFGSPALQQRFIARLADNRASACLAMTEPQAGSDVGAIRTFATKQPDGTYTLEGEKVFISAGMQDLTENIFYVTLARTSKERKGTLGLSVFIVPRFQVSETGEKGEDNHVRCLRLEEKMGLHGCATAHLTFGQDGRTVAYLLGDRENVGLQQLMSMMNQARIATGLYALGPASSAYLNALEYAGQRVQGTRSGQSFNPGADRVRIIEHVDVQRMLLEMKAKVEGCRALITKLTYHQSMATMLAGQADADAARRHQGFVDLLTPLVKAYTSDQAFRVAELAIQTMGGYGYVADYPVEQVMRDVKVMSIWEGTNYIQSMDLIREKLGYGTGMRLFAPYLEDLRTFLAKSEGTPRLTREYAALARALGGFERMHAKMTSLAKARQLPTIEFMATRFLESMAELTVGWLLLEGAELAARRLEAGVTGDDARFYEEKVQAARFYLLNVLPGVSLRAQLWEEAEILTPTATIAF